MKGYRKVGQTVKYGDGFGLPPVILSGSSKPIIKEGLNCLAIGLSGPLAGLKFALTGELDRTE